MECAQCCISPSLKAQGLQTCLSQHHIVILAYIAVLLHIIIIIPRVVIVIYYSVQNIFTIWPVTIVKIFCIVIISTFSLTYRYCNRGPHAKFGFICNF